MRRVETVADLQALVGAARRKGLSVGFVPTMGAFHEGHLTLMREARRNNHAVIVSIFVNPIQFSAGEDYDRYPRRLEQDTKMAESEGVDVIFAPSVAEMYPKGFDTYVDQTDLPDVFVGFEAVREAVAVGAVGEQLLGRVGPAPVTGRRP